MRNSLAPAVESHKAIPALDSIGSVQRGAYLCSDSRFFLRFGNDKKTSDEHRPKVT